MAREDTEGAHKRARLQRSNGGNPFSRPAGHSLTRTTRAMKVFALYIINKSGGLIFHKVGASRQLGKGAAASHAPAHYFLTPPLPRTLR